MKPRETIIWLQVALGGSGFMLLLHTGLSLIPGANALDGHFAFTVITVLLAVTYLLILSWRAAYLSGRSKR